MDVRNINGNAEKAKEFAEEALQNGNVVLALDLDYTLAHYRDRLEGLFEVARKLGVPESAAKSALATTEGAGFSLKLFHSVLFHGGHLSVDEDQFVKLTALWFKDSYTLYDDAYEFLGQYLERVPVVIVTAGNEEFQREKIKILDFFPDDIVVVPMGTAKIGALKDVYRRYQKLVVFVDDNPREFSCISLDAWFGFPATSYSIRMLRDDSPHVRAVGHLASHNVRTINSFTQFQELSLSERSIHE